VAWPYRFWWFLCAMIKDTYTLPKEKKKKRKKRILQLQDVIEVGLSIYYHLYAASNE